MKLRFLCVHPELDKSVPCDLVETGDFSDFWYVCPVCKREVGFQFVSEDDEEERKRQYDIKHKKELKI